MPKVNLVIDGKSIVTEAGTSVLEAAREAGIHIPTLCYIKEQNPKANCRICLVEVAGRRGLLPSCATQVAEGMVVKTTSPAIVAARKTNLELLIANHPMDCQHCARNGACNVDELSEEMCKYCVICDCPQDGACELQTLAKEYNAAMGDFDWKERNEPIDKSTQVIVKDPSKCVLCGRCIAACSEQQGINVWSRVGRGSRSKVVAALNRPLAESPCVRCGLCVKECPTGALTMAQDHWDISLYLDDKSKKKIARIEPSFIAELATLKGFDDLELSSALMVSALNKLGVNEMEPAITAEKQMVGMLAEELKKQEKKPLITRDSYAVVRMMEKRYPELIKNLAQTGSGQEVFFDNCDNMESDKVIYPIAFTSSISRKDEARAKGHGPKTAKVITPLEVKRLFKRSAIELQYREPDAEYGPDLTVESLLLDVAGLIEDELVIDGEKYSVLIAQGLREVNEVLKQVKAGECKYDLIQLEAVAGEAVDIRKIMN